MNASVDHNALRRRAIGLLPLLAIWGCGADGMTASEPHEEIRFATLSAGLQATCGTATDGRLFCWGAGIGSLGVEPTLAPHRVGRRRFSAVSVGDSHACVLGSTGAVYCWGANQHHQLGDGSTSDRAAPTPVATATTEIGVGVGGQHSCVLDPDGTLRCWGWGATGQLGVGRIVDLGYPLRTEGFTFEKVSAGAEHTCALTPDGTALCWGRDDHGQVGASATDSCLRDGTGLGCVLRPTPVEADVHFVELSAGESHTCAVDTESRAWCWGVGSAGQLGTGGFADSPVPVLVATDVRFRAIAAGSRHTCALDLEGRAWCWGHNAFGRLGREEASGPVPLPIAVSTDLRFTDITAGALHTCAIAEDGRAYCWGFGGFGQLGTGEPISQAVPKPVAPPA